MAYRMRRLLINNRIRAFAERYSSEVQKLQPNVTVELADLRDSIIKYNTWKDPKVPEMYINTLIADYPALLTLEPKDWDFKKYDDISKLDSGMLTREVIYGYTKEQVKGGTVVKPSRALKNQLYERILFCLRYKEARSILGPIHQDMGLKTCVYCNINPTDSSPEGDVFYEMDHFKAKSDFPFLGTCFYNLQPCDGACNKRKSAQPCDFQLYLNDATEELSPFRFVPQVVELDKTRGTHQCIKIDFVDIDGNYSADCEQYDNTFDIIKHYSAHYRDVEQIYWKNSQCGVTGSAEHYRRSVGYDPTEDEVYNYCLGFPLNEDLIHEEPLRKLKIDTVKQLKENGVLKV